MIQNNVYLWGTVEVESYEPESRFSKLIRFVFGYVMVGTWALGVVVFMNILASVFGLR